MGLVNENIKPVSSDELDWGFDLRIPTTPIKKKSRKYDTFGNNHFLAPAIPVYNKQKSMRVAMTKSGTVEQLLAETTVISPIHVL